MKNDIHELKGMGVINITPDSFSDGGIHFNRDNLLSTINLFQQHKSIIFDFGFESTAPMNSSISLFEEKSRFSFFIEAVKTSNLKNEWVSFDTYKIENFKFFFNETLKLFPQTKIIMNDVSGVLDEELFELFTEYKHFANFFYVFSSTNIPNRNFTNNHMDFISDKNIFDQTYEQIKKFLLFSRQFPEMQGRFFLDPAFGFSKSYIQNWDLIERLNELIDKIENEFTSFPWILGLSKKSFLKKKLIEQGRALHEIEDLHREIILNLKSNSYSSQLIFRVHHLDILL